MSWFRNLGSSIASGFSSAGSAIKSGLGKVFDMDTGYFAPFLQGVQSRLVPAGSDMSNPVSAVGAVLKGLPDTLSYVVDKGKDVVDTVSATAKGTIGKVPILGDIVNPLIDDATGIAKGGLELVEGGINEAKTVGEALKSPQGAIDVINKYTTAGITQTPEQLKQIGKDTMKGIISGNIKGQDVATDLAKRVGDISFAPKNSVLSGPPMPQGRPAGMNRMQGLNFGSLGLDSFTGQSFNKLAGNVGNALRNGASFSEANNMMMRGIQNA